VYRKHFITHDAVERMKRQKCAGPRDRLGAIRELVVAVYLDRRVRRTPLPAPDTNGSRVGVGVKPKRAHHALTPGSYIFGIGRRRR